MKKLIILKKIFVPEDKSLSIRCALLASQALGKSRLKLLDSEDIRSTLNCLRRLGIKIIKHNDYYDILSSQPSKFRRRKATRTLENKWQNDILEI